MRYDNQIFDHLEQLREGSPTLRIFHCSCRRSGFSFPSTNILFRQTFFSGKTSAAGMAFPGHPPVFRAVQPYRRESPPSIPENPRLPGQATPGILREEHRDTGRCRPIRPIGTARAPCRQATTPPTHRPRDLPPESTRRVITRVTVRRCWFTPTRAIPSHRVRFSSGGWSSAWSSPRSRNQPSRWR